MTDSAEKVKRPASQYYWGDWFKDVALQTCSQPARGLWHEMNCLMHQGEPYGHLTMPNGKPMQPMQLANLCKISAAACKKMIQELEDNGVLSRADSGAIFSRRMVRDEDVRNRRAEGGKGGAEHGVKGAESGSKGGRPKQLKGGSETPLETPLTPTLEGFEKPPPSSSSSSSSSPSVNSVPDGTGSAAAKPAADLTKQELWSAGKSLLSQAGMPEKQCGSFVGKLVKDYGEAIVVDMVRAAVVAQPADPAQWLKAACMRAAGERAAVPQRNGQPDPHRGFDTRNYEDHPDGQFPD